MLSLFEYVRPKVSLLLQNFCLQKKTFSVPLQLLDQLWNTFRKICATEPGELWLPCAIIDVTLRNLFYSKWSICHSQSNTSWVFYKSTFIQDNILIFIFFTLGVQRSLTSVTVLCPFLDPKETSCNLDSRVQVLLHEHLLATHNTVTGCC